MAPKGDVTALATMCSGVSEQPGTVEETMGRSSGYDSNCLSAAG